MPARTRIHVDCSTSSSRESDSGKDDRIAASSMDAVKDWDNTNSRHRHEKASSDTEHNEGVDDDEILTCVSDEPQRSPPAVDSVYGAMPRIQLMGRRSEIKEDSSSSERSLVEDLLSPFLACGGGLAKHVRQTPSGPCQMEQESGERRNLFDPLWTALKGRSWSWDERSLDSRAEEERLQLQRLTSWSTYGTYDTYKTEKTQRSVTTESTIESAAESLPVDDEGNVIPRALIKQAHLRRNQRKARRKRVVKFDYPPIRSVRECPRADPNDLPNLFFTEEELDEIEDDRYNTRFADDVEIVAIQTGSTDDAHAPTNDADDEGDCDHNNKQEEDSRQETIDDDEWDRLMYGHSGKMTSEDSGDSHAPVFAFSGYRSTPKLAKSKLSHPHIRTSQEAEILENVAPFPAFLDGDERDPPCAEDHDDGAVTNPQEELFSRSESSEVAVKEKSKKRKTRKKKKLVRGVEIYLRERSTGH